MLSLAKLGRGSEGYYLDAVARGAEDYYVGRGEAPGFWTGRGAGLLGLDGEVTAEALSAVLTGVAPDGSPLGAGNRTVPGFDLTFSVPKSVSVLAALRPELSEQIVDACEVAVVSALAWLEGNACFSRRGRNGVEHVAGDGFVAAAFRHRTSRAGDPQLHWHVLAANTTRGPDGQWRTLDGTRLYPALRTAGFLFEAELRHQLSERLGAQWRPTRHGIAEIDGVPAEVLRRFSKRRSQIEDRLAIAGYASGRAAQVAALATRDHKAGPESDLSLRQRWQDEATEIGYDPATLDAVLGRPRRSVSMEESMVELLRPNGLTRDESTFTRFDVVRALAERTLDGATIDQLDEAADRLLGDPEVVDLGASTEHGYDVTLASGRRLGSGTRRYSTRELLTIERRILELAITPGRTARPQLDRSLAGAFLNPDQSLSDEQRTAVERLVTRGSLVDTLIAPAGSGKTYSLDRARQAWEHAGYRVIGAALAARAALELETQAHIPSRTITKFLMDLEAGTERLDLHTVLVIDEAAMVATRDLAPIFDAAHHGRGRLVLVGDPRQLQAIAAGGVLRGLAERLPPIELSENRRQRHSWERDALAQLRAGEVGRFLTAYQHHGRITVGDTADQAKAMLITHWTTQVGFGLDVIILALRRDDVTDLNHRARTELLARGRLGPDALVAGDREFREGDRVVCLANRRSHGLLNGLRGEVTQLDPVERSMTIRLGDGSARVVPARYLDAGHLDHGYALTIHKAQGVTVDAALVYATAGLYREAAYTALSRARHDTRLYLPASDFTDDPHLELTHRRRQRPDALTATLDRIMTRGRADQLAIDHRGLGR